MTLKIKIPPTRQAQPPPPSLQPQSSIPGPMQDETITKPQRIRKKPKRFLDQDDDEYEAVQHKQKKPARTASAKRDRRPSVTEHSDAEMAPAYDDVDSLDATMDEPDVESEDASPPPPKSTSSVKSQPKLAKGKGKAAASKKKKRNVLMSDSEDEDDNYMDTTLDAEAGNVDDDNDEPDSPEERPVKLAKRASSKGTSGSQGTKRKAKAEAVEPVHAEKKAGSSVAASRKKPKLPPKNEEMIDVVGDSAHEGGTKADRSSPVPIPQDSPVVVPKKPKLPTIKKNKLPTSSAVSTPQSNPSTAKPTIELGLNKHTNHGEIRKTMINQTDIDLSNKSIYQEIFLKMTGDTGTPRRTKEEERRKELNRLRDEARAKRLEEARHSFDLQAQYDKISRFEDKLRSERSSALWPNFLGAKWRENYEKEKRRQKEQQQWQGASYEGKEEGEVS